MPLIHGVPVGYATPEEAEAADVMVCMDWSQPLILPDNQRASCFGCSRALQHRPDAPRKPPKVCMECAAAWARPS